MGQKELKSDRGTIVAVSTPHGMGGIAVIRMSGPESVSILKKVWKGRNPELFDSHTAHLGWILDSDGQPFDQVVATIFKGPNSYTGEDVFELSCHGSVWIQREIVHRLVEEGATAAGPGEFTLRAFHNGRIDLAQADGIADLISSTSKAAARIASSQMRGRFSEKLEKMRRQLVDLGVLLELELDFSEEDVEFADRSKLISLSEELLKMIRRLAVSFKSGNAFKHGVPVAIAGVPNSGKSTLLNALLGEERAIVSEIPGTTRDVIEDTVEINGILFRFIDTAGIRETSDVVEKIGVERALEKMNRAAIVLYVIDPTQDEAPQLEQLQCTENLQGEILKIISKGDILGESTSQGLKISAKTGEGIDELKDTLTAIATKDFNPEQEIIITNARHYEALKKAEAPLERLLEGLRTGLTADFLAQELREADGYLGEITGAVTSDEILHTIFRNYCIGK